MTSGRQGAGRSPESRPSSRSAGRWWGGDSLGELLAKKIDPEPAIAQVPDALRAVTRALLDAAPELRPDAAAVRELLVRLGRGERIEVVDAPGTPTVRERPIVRRTKRRWVIAGAIAGAAIASVIAVLATRAHDRKHPETLRRGSAAATAGSAGSDPWATGSEVVRGRREQ